MASIDSIIIDGDLFQGHYDESNALVLPSKRVKRDSKPTQVEQYKKQRLLSKKQRKSLEKVVKRRGDKKNRAELLNELQKHVLPDNVYKSFTPLVQVQKTCKGERRKKNKVNKAFAKDSDLVGNSTNTKSHRTNGMESDGSDISEEEIKQVNRPDLVICAQTCKTPSRTQSDKQNQSDKSQDTLKTSSITAIKFPNKKSSRADRANEQEKRKINDSKGLKFVIPHRTKEIESIRSKLPIIGEEQAIMEAVRENLVVVIAGETGSGKTTQVPQFLYEAGYARDGKMIGVTEPRRIAAIAMSQRVSKELNLAKNVVSYQIRFEGNTSKKTKIKFMTDGVLMKEMEKDFLLSNYSVICIDEAHERSLYTDILIGLLSRAIGVRHKSGDPLRIVIMSATMRVEDFTSNPLLFKTTPSLIHIPVRQFQVHIHFNKVTPDNYLDAARKKVAKIHKTLPVGGILVFVTGQEDVKRLVKILSNMFPKVNTDAEETSPTVKKSKSKVVEFDLKKLPTFPVKDGEENSDDSDDNSMDEDVGDDDAQRKPLHVIPLYSMLSTSEQTAIFQPPPPGMRVCVVATNVAETSLTIPNIRYVVDCGKVKLKLWDKVTGVHKFEVKWCSKASAEQRAGRAGRTGPGHCYRLFSSAVYNTEFGDYSIPEIAVRPVDDMILLMKSMSINHIHTFPYPTHPGDEQLVAAERLLILLGALEIPAHLTSSNVKGDKSRITPIGKTMVYLPVSPRYSKMLALGFTHSVAEYVITLVAALSVQEMLLDAHSDSDDRVTRLKWQQIRRRWGGTGSSLLLGDCMVLLRAVGAFEYDGGSYESAVGLGLRYKAMLEVRKLRKKLTTDINLVVESQETLLNPQMKPPSIEQCDILRQVILSGCPDRIARAISPDELTGDMRKLKHAYWCGDLEDPVFIYDSSVLRGTYPEWIVYQESFEFNGKIFLKGITAIDPDWIPAVCPVLFQAGHTFRFRSYFNKKK